jgi:oligopeptidase A
MSESDNPLLTQQGLPAFADIRPGHVTPAIDVLLSAAELALERAAGPEVPADYHALSAVIDVAVERLGRAWGTVSHLNHVADTPEMRAAYTANLPRVTDFFTRVGADERLFAKYKSVDTQAQRLNAEQSRVLSNALRDFVLSGADLRGQPKQRFMQIEQQLADAQQQFSEHVQDATDAWAYYADDAEMAGVPEDVRAAAQSAADADARAGYKLTLRYPCWMPVMQYARDRALRERLYRAYTTRASELGRVEHDNTGLIAQILNLRQEQAALLGYPNYAALSLVPKMANSVEQVDAFLRDLAQRVRQRAELDWAELKSFAADGLALPDLQLWDQHFVAERLRESRFAFNEQQVKQYFTLPHVLAGLFRIAESLFEVVIREDRAPVWHDSVRFFRIERRHPDGDAAQLVGQFYLDPYARAGKRPGAWMDDARGRWARPDESGALQTPVAYLVCNFAPPVGDQPALLTHDDVVTLFHEFGHGLHHMLTQVNELALAGCSGVEWDAVELPSQFMENFCWEWDVLSRLSSHIDTGAALPRALFDKMLAAKNFHSALDNLRQVELALFDLRIHAEPLAAEDTARVLGEVRAQVAVVQPPQFHRLPHTFSHIFAGGYAAGYYSYKWAEVLSADAYSAFEEAGVWDAATGQRYRREILEAGGSRPAIDSFKAFRGREPCIDALLRHQGIT